MVSAGTCHKGGFETIHSRVYLGKVIATAHDTKALGANLGGTEVGRPPGAFIGRAGGFQEFLYLVAMVAFLKKNFAVRNIVSLNVGVPRFLVLALAPRRSFCGSSRRLRVARKLHQCQNPGYLAK